MKRVVCIFAVAMICSIAMAQKMVDFASKFIEACEGDTAVHCVTVGPKMMEQLTKHHDDNRNEFVTQAIQKLKSARIVMATADGDNYYDRAEQLLKKYPKRFSHSKDYRNDHAHGAFYTRQAKNGKVVELIMLHYDQTKNELIIVNLTGDIDEEFTELLTKNLGSKK